MSQISICVHILNPFSDKVWVFNFVKMLFELFLKMFGNRFNMYLIIPTIQKFVVYISCNHNVVKCFNNGWYCCFERQNSVFIM